MKFLLRDEARASERRAPITPDDAATLVQKGVHLKVERSDKRIFADSDYEQAGCPLVPAGSWLKQDADTVILGLKELPPQPQSLSASMVHFAHIYKQQAGWQDELARFSRGGGILYDIEYLTRADGWRVAAFGTWAGWMGAALAIWQLLARDNDGDGPGENLTSFDGRDAIIDQISQLAAKAAKPLRAVVIGAKGRCGGGAIAALEIAGAEISKWDIEETANLDSDALLAHDILVNCVLINGPGLMLATPDDLKLPNCRLRMIADVACDPFSSFNPLPIYDGPTSWQKPFISLGNNGQGENIELTAIDNLPSLMPREASIDFSAQFSPCLLNFDQGEEWQSARAIFDNKVVEANS